MTDQETADRRKQKDRRKNKLIFNLSAICVGFGMYGMIATHYAIPEVTRQIAQWGFEQRMIEAQAAKDDAARAKQSGVVNSVFDRALATN